MKAKVEVCDVGWEAAGFVETILEYSVMNLDHQAQSTDFGITSFLKVKTTFLEARLNPKANLLISVDQTATHIKAVLLWLRINALFYTRKGNKNTISERYWGEKPVTECPLLWTYHRNKCLHDVYKCFYFLSLVRIIFVCVHREKKMNFFVEKPVSCCVWCQDVLKDSSTDFCPQCGVKSGTRTFQQTASKSSCAKMKT